MKCRACKEVKSLASFSPTCLNKDGKTGRCQSCVSKVSKSWRRKNPEKVKRMDRRKILKKYSGMSVEEYDSLLVQQKGVCAICKSKHSVRRGHKISFSVDHSHKTNPVRGLLCNQCNRAIGLFKDNSQLLHTAAEYLERTS